MLLKKIPALLACSLLLLTAKAQQPKERSSLLWEISGKGLKSPSWLYGTIHMLCPQDHHFSAATLNAVKQSKSMYLEVNMDDKEEMTEMQAAVVMPEPYSFRALLSPEDYEKLSAWFHDSLHVELAVMDKLKPIVMYSFMTLKFTAASCSTPISLEAEFIKLAKEQQIPVRGLEKAMEQLALFDSIPDTEEAAMMVKSVSDVAKSAEVYGQLIATYKTGDIEALYNHLLETEDMVQYKEILLDNRNRNWISTITSEAHKAPAFFAVGAGHLGGNTGVIALLRKQGYTVKPVQ